MAAVDFLGAIELHHGYKPCRQASELIDAIFNRPNELQRLNESADRLSRNELKHCLAMMVRCDARLADQSHILSILS
jgi:uncharacterized protein with von Willebrand factor type A (vWA) domain